jgi:hypothetical protein
VENCFGEMENKPLINIEEFTKLIEEFSSEMLLSVICVLNL